MRRDNESAMADEVSDTLLPGKATKLQLQIDRTANRHWCAR
jgi:hypothetical protein